MSKKWAEDYSSDEGSVGENDIPSDEDIVPTPAHMQKQPSQQAARYNIVPPSDKTFFAVFVSEIDYSLDRKAVGTFFESAGCKLTNVMLNPDDRKGTASIKFADKASLDVALSLNGTDVKGRNLKIVLLGGNDVLPRHDNNHSRRGPHDAREKVSARAGNERDRDVRGKERFNDQRIGGFNDRNDARLTGRPATRGKAQPIVKSAAATSLDNQSAMPSTSAGAAAEVPTRPKLNLQPRSLPLEAIGQPVAKRNIFGEGRPHDEMAYEELRKKGETTTQVLKATNEKVTEPTDCAASADVVAAASSETVFDFAGVAAAVPEVAPTLSLAADVSGTDSKRENVDGKFTKTKKTSGQGSSNRGPPAVEGGKVFKPRGVGEDVRQPREGAAAGRGRGAGQGRGHGGRGGANASTGPLQTGSSDLGQATNKSKPHGKIASNNKLFQTAVHQTGGGGGGPVDKKDSKKSAATVAAVNTGLSSVAASSNATSGGATAALTDEERFLRAQETFKTGNNSQNAVSSKPKVNPGGFAALGFMSEDEESDA